MLPPQSSPNPQQSAPTAPQAAGGPPQIAPQGNPAVQPSMAPQHGDKPSGRVGQAYDPKILAHIEQHLTQLPDQQKAYLVQYMTPELAIILGIVIGQEAYDYFKQYADPKKMLVVQPRPQQQNAAPQPGQQAPQQAQSPQGAAPQGATPPPAQSAPPIQPKANVPAKSIMAV